MCIRVRRSGDLRIAGMAIVNVPDAFDRLSIPESNLQAVEIDMARTLVGKTQRDVLPELAASV